MVEYSYSDQSSMWQSEQKRMVFSTILQLTEWSARLSSWIDMADAKRGRHLRYHANTKCASGRVVGGGGGALLGATGKREHCNVWPMYWWQEEPENKNDGNYNIGQSCSQSQSAHSGSKKICGRFFGKLWNCTPSARCARLLKLPIGRVNLQMEYLINRNRIFRKMANTRSSVHVVTTRRYKGRKALSVGLHVRPDEE